ncbi:spore coat polysaccharide biosynthesis protein SpsF [Anaerosolibacter carboniphilus]|uniref:Spore coat polysaccharide biosynthesis protein SpsF n=1 Tax=Anaerosolibacter carboniphilus TaxID=1417629 RepID=A0A841KXS9_9FIRM|nr:GNAT family N-acetyltransferase [Anaerosolibacter carboniphilus]MBB6215732.1 spore coat polysaccharide biosynthesis protein SpsF [Anaerosolibacter carboniphilus]
MCIQFVLAQSKHCDLLFKWTNDIEVRNNSFRTDFVEYEEHKKWFYGKLNSGQCLLYICYHGEEAIGQVRIDLEEHIGVINYSVAKEYRGKGYGTNILKEVIEIIRSEKTNIKKLIGRVKHSNISSQKAFEKAAYDFVKAEEYIEYYKLI